MRVELDEDPIGPFLYTNAGATPALKTIHCQRIVLRQRSIFNSGNRQTAYATSPIEHQRTGENDRQLQLVTDSQSSPGAMRPRFRKRMRSEERRVGKE